MYNDLYQKELDENGNEIYIPIDINEIKICGKNIDEIITILQGLEFERIYDIKMTMENLQQFINIYQNEQQEMIKRSIEEQFGILKE